MRIKLDLVGKNKYGAQPTISDFTLEIGTHDHPNTCGMRFAEDPSGR
jgi:hypothetical protein